MSKIREALGLFPSMIKSGEEWSAIASGVLSDAREEMVRLEDMAADYAALRRKVDEALAKLDQLAIDHPSQALIIEAFTNDFR